MGGREGGGKVGKEVGREGFVGCWEGVYSLLTVVSTMTITRTTLLSTKRQDTVSPVYRIYCNDKTKLLALTES